MSSTDRFMGHALQMLRSDDAPNNDGTTYTNPAGPSLSLPTFEPLEQDDIDGIIEMGKILEDELDDIKQEKDEAGRASVQQPQPQPSRIESYGTNNNVYNPYKPYTSKDFIDQEVAAGRMDASNTPCTSSSIEHVARQPASHTIKPHGDDSNAPVNALVSPRRALSDQMNLQRNTAPNPIDRSSSQLSQLLTGLSSLDSFAQAQQVLTQEYDDDDTESNSDREDAVDSQSPSSRGGSVSQKGHGFLSGLSLSNGVRQRRIARSKRKFKLTTIPTPWQNVAGARTKRADPPVDSTPTIPTSSDRKRRRAGSMAGSSRTPLNPEAIPFVPAGQDSSIRFTNRNATASSSGGAFRPFLQGDPLRWALEGIPRLSSIISGEVTPPRLPANIRQRIGQMLGTDLIPTPSLLPSWHNLRTSSLVFTSEIIPRNIPYEKRYLILNILRTKALYVPACTSMEPAGPSIQYYLHTKSLSVSSLNQRSFDHRPISDTLIWPNDCIPVEVFHEIASYLPRKSIEAMRLVNHEFEEKVSNVQFHSVVVGFRPEIYGMMIHDQIPGQVEMVDVKGKGKAKELPIDEEDPVIQDINDGMKVFQAWGPHIKKFAMAFEVDEIQLMRPPLKGKFQDFTTFWGHYRWPHPHYRRFEFCAGLEKKADEYRCMSAALSNLGEIQELALSLDNALGWLAGPDISDRAQIFREKPRIFGSSDAQTRARHDKGEELWQNISSSLVTEHQPIYNVQNGVISKDNLPIQQGSDGFHHAQVHFDRSKKLCRSSVLFDETTDADSNRPLVFQGIDLRYNTAAGNPHFDIHNTSLSNKETPFSGASIIPSKLTIAQKEWLLETEWAQHAFISSYCMAVTDNSQTFSHVHSLNIAKLSSKHIISLHRSDFWETLPNLSNLTLMVSADYRTVYKNNSGIVESAEIQPSSAAIQFCKLLRHVVGHVKGITTMQLGYSEGGEHQTGIFGRNQNVLPAPLVDYSESGVFWQSHRMVLALPHVEHLTLTNCWIAPPTLKTFIAKLKKHSIRTLTFDSVSLSGHSGVPVHMELDPVERGVTMFPQGPARTFNDPHIGNLFDQRPPILSDPVPGQTDGWMFNPGRVGSWANVIDTISPGPTMDLLRYAYQYTDQPPPKQDPGRFERINFKSCGYVRLRLTTLDQSVLPPVVSTPPACIQARAAQLMPVMMHRNEDSLLGQIAPSMSDEEQIVFQTAFPMRMGWGDDERKYDNLEDGQPEGGSGRFSGFVEKLTYSSPR